MLQVFLPLIGLQDMRAFRFSAANVTEIQRVFARSITSRKKDFDPRDKERTETISLHGLERRPLILAAGESSRLDT